MYLLEGSTHNITTSYTSSKCLLSTTKENIEEIVEGIIDMFSDDSWEKSDEWRRESWLKL